jgi:hypothetical protein
MTDFAAPGPACRPWLGRVFMGRAVIMAAGLMAAWQGKPK